MKKGAANYIVRLFIQRALGLLCYLLGARWVMNLRAWVYFVAYFLAAAVCSAVMWRVNRQTLAERAKTNTDSPKWDKLLLGAYWLLAFFVIYLVAGLEAKTAPRVGVAFWIGFVLQIPAAWLSLRALMVNAFLESTARLQTDRGQTVCKTGPYAVVRHPTYSAILIWCVSISMLFQTIGVGLVAALIAVIIIARTDREDRMLQEGLAGYADYAREVRYRLVPRIW